MQQSQKHRLGLALLAGIAFGLIAAPVLAEAPKSPAEDFAALDLNQDGSLDWKEYRSRVSEIFFFADTNSDGRIDGDEAAALGSGVAVREGGISHADFLDEHRKSFDRLDRNRDGRLSLAEATGG